MFETAWQDVRYGFRLLRRSPLFTLTAVLSLAIGIGANTTIFSVASALLLRPLPGLAEPDRLVDIGRTQDGGGFDTTSYPNFQDVRQRATTLSDVYAYRVEPQPISLSDGQEAERIYGSPVSGNYFRTLGSTPARGRLLNDGDDTAGRPSRRRHQLRIVAAPIRRRTRDGRPHGDVQQPSRRHRRHRAAAAFRAPR